MSRICGEYPSEVEYGAVVAVVTGPGVGTVVGTGGGITIYFVMVFDPAVFAAVNAIE